MCLIRNLLSEGGCSTVLHANATFLLIQSVNGLLDCVGIRRRTHAYHSGAQETGIDVMTIADTKVIGLVLVFSLPLLLPISSVKGGSTQDEAHASGSGELESTTRKTSNNFASKSKLGNEKRKDLKYVKYDLKSLGDKHSAQKDLLKVENVILSKLLEKKSFEEFKKRLGNLTEDEIDDVKQFLVWKSVVDSVSELNSKKKKVGNREKRDEEVVCYGELGCYRDVGFFDYLDTLPQPPSEIQTRFILHNHETESEGEIIDYKNASSLYYSRFMNSAPIKVVIHGFGGGGTKEWVVDMKNTLLKSGNFNVIIVDWEKGAPLPNYVQAAANTKLVGKQLSLLMEMINFQRGKKNQDYHIIGFSLGAHVAGFAGMSSKNISRITGLDPAAPLFEGYEDEDRLDVSDANFVDIIHSNGEHLLFGGLGAYERMGDVDYYPNGGKSQVGCTNLLVGALSDIIWNPNGHWESLCNHKRAYQMFTDSIMRHCPFPSFACENFDNFVNGECFPCNDDERCGNMGYYADQTRGRGKLYLVTREKRPFCANQYMIQVNSSAGSKITWGRLEITLIANDGENETFTLTEESDEIVSERVIKKVVVAHPSLHNITHVELRYTQYDGWIYDGKTAWGIDAISLVDSNAKKLHYCGFPVKLRSKIPVKLPVDIVECNHRSKIKLGPPAPIITITKPQRRGRMLWVHNAKKRFPYPFYIPHETVVISRYQKKPGFARRKGRLMRHRAELHRDHQRWSSKESHWRGRNRSLRGELPR